MSEPSCEPLQSVSMCLWRKNELRPLWDTAAASAMIVPPGFVFPPLPIRAGGDKYCSSEPATTAE